MKSKTLWTTNYRGISIEINNFELLGDAWTYYLYVRLEQLPEDIREEFWLDPRESMLPSKRLFYPYSDAIFSRLDWHGGITYYKKHGHDGNPRIVQIGCDYQHSFDEGQHYNERTVLADAKDCVDSLHALIPDIKRWCPYCGAYFVPHETQKYCGQCDGEEL